MERRTLRAFAVRCLRAHLRPTAAPSPDSRSSPLPASGGRKNSSPPGSRGAIVIGSCFFADHHPYTDDEICELKAVAGDACW
jgi:hypothetical protein